MTSKQARNIIQRLQRNNPAEQRLKEMLHKLVQVEGNDVLLIQDQFSITSGKAEIQKRIFRKWGECLVMDWTHGTNNLGYHLGESTVLWCGSL